MKLLQNLHHIQYITSLHHPYLHNNIPQVTALYASAILPVSLHCTALHCTALHCTDSTALHCTRLHAVHYLPQDAAGSRGHTGVAGRQILPRSLHCTAQRCTTQHCLPWAAARALALLPRSLHCTAHCTALHTACTGLWPKHMAMREEQTAKSVSSRQPTGLAPHLAPWPAVGDARQPGRLSVPRPPQPPAHAGSGGQAGREPRGLGAGCLPMLCCWPDTTDKGSFMDG